MKDRKKLIAYCCTGNLQDMTEEDILVLDSVHIAFGLINEDGVYWKEKDAAEQMTKIRNVHPGIQIVLSIGGWGADGFSQAAQTGAGRERWIASVLKLTGEYGFDGIDLDWEYPCSDKAGIRAIPEDGENYVLLIRELREALNGFEQYKSLSIAAGALKTYLEAVPMNRIVEYLDYVQLMTYDFKTSWDITTGHHANLYSYGEGTPNSDEIISLFVAAGVPCEKLVMGGAFYGRGWTKAAEGAPGTPAQGSHEGYPYHELMNLLNDSEGGYRKYWDDDAKAATLYNGDSFISYEDEEALAYKADYVNAHNMYGMMYWEYSEDETRTLTSHVRRCLDKGQ